MVVFFPLSSENRLHSLEGIYLKGACYPLCPVMYMLKKQTKTEDFITESYVWKGVQKLDKNNHSAYFTGSTLVLQGRMDSITQTISRSKH